MHEHVDVEGRKIEAIKDDAEDFYSDDDLYNITSWGADLSFRELITQYQDGDLVKPEMQRHYVWDKAEASRFIDSLLLGLPVPSIFLAKIGDKRTLIVDGYQRIMTVHDYFTGIFGGDGKAFALTRSEKINEKWRGKSFLELTEAQQRLIRTTTIHCIIFAQVRPKNDTSLYQVFERINTSGRTLTPQEIRNCIYQGAFNSLLFELNLLPAWRSLLGFAKPDSRMRDMEFILRFFALADLEISDGEETQISLKKYLNEYMGSDASKDDETLNDRRDEFESTLHFVAEALGPTAFQNVSKKSPGEAAGKFNPTIFDSIMIATSRHLKAHPSIAPGDLRARKASLLSNEEFKDLIRVRTTRKDRIRNRIRLAADYLFGAGGE